MSSCSFWLLFVIHVQWWSTRKRIEEWSEEEWRSSLNLTYIALLPYQKQAAEERDGSPICRESERKGIHGRYGRNGREGDMYGIETAIWRNSRGNGVLGVDIYLWLVVFIPWKRETPSFRWSSRFSIREANWLIFNRLVLLAALSIWKYEFYEKSVECSCERLIS